MFVSGSWIIFFCIFVAEATSDLYQKLDKLSSPEVLVEELHNLIQKDVGFTEECSKQLDEYRRSLLAFQPWAMQMFDSASKIPVGLLHGTSGDLGDFNECLNIETTTAVGNIFGKYCLGQTTFNIDQTRLQPKSLKSSWKYIQGNFINPLVIKLATCLPHACTTADIQKFYSLFEVNYKITDINCQSKATDTKLDIAAISAIAIFAVIVCLMVISTIYDVYNYYNKTKPFHKLAMAFSVFTNGKKLISVNNNPSQLTCLHGIRTFTLAGIVLAHRFKIISTQAMMLNRRDMVQWSESFASAYLLGNYILVDSFLLMSGLVITYSFSHSMDRGDKFNVLQHYYHRYIRLTPPVAAVTLVAVSLLKHLGFGPQWPIMVRDNFEDNCRKYWWSGLLYVQNYVNPEEPCLGQTWYLSVDTQLFILSPVLLIVFHKYPKIKLHVLLLIILLLPLSPFLVCWFGEYQVMFVSEPKEWRRYVNNVYYPTHTRALPWFVGFGAGYAVYTTRKLKFTVSLKTMTRKILFVTYWILTIAGLYSCYMIGYFVQTSEYNKLTNSLYSAFIGLIWCISLTCLIIPCVNGYGGIINWILSNPFMNFFSKLSYSMYLVHNMVLYRNIHRQRTNLIFEDFEFLYEFWSDFMHTAFLAVFWVLAFEFPVVEIENFIWPRNKKTPKPVQKFLEENDSAATKKAP